MNTVRSRDTGYTIVETMIFLAVSGALFLSAMLLVNGQQRKTEFATQVRDFDTKLQSVISNVASGYYNNNERVTCEAPAGTPIITYLAAPDPAAQGQNSDCTFIGQYIYLNPTPPNNDRFIITSHAGLRLNPAGQEVQSLAEAVPTPITQTAEDYTLLSGVTANVKLFGGVDIATLAITTTFGTYTSGLLASGSSRVEMHAYDSSGTEIPITNQGIQICLSDGTDQVGVILLNNGSTRTTINTNAPAVCP